jgi:hypothetical protein
MQLSLPLSLSLSLSLTGATGLGLVNRVLTDIYSFRRLWDAHTLFTSQREREGERGRERERERERDVEYVFQWKGINVNRALGGSTYLG